MRHSVAVSSATCLAPFLSTGCGGPTKPDTEDRSLARSRQDLEDSGVPEGNITVVGKPDELFVREQDPDGVALTEPVGLEVANTCAREDDSSHKKKRPRVRRRR